MLKKVIKITNIVGHLFLYLGIILYIGSFIKIIDIVVITSDLYFVFWLLGLLLTLPKRLLEICEYRKKNKKSVIELKMFFFTFLVIPILVYLIVKT